MMGVCCIVCDIDGMLFEFIMNFLNIEKNKILIILFSICHAGGGGGVWIFFHVLCYFQHYKKY